MCIYLELLPVSLGTRFTLVIPPHNPTRVRESPLSHSYLRPCQFSTQLSGLSKRFNSQITRTAQTVHHSNASLTPETLPDTPGLDTCVQASEEKIMLSAKKTVAYFLYTKLPNEFPQFCPVAAHLPLPKEKWFVGY